MRKKLIEVALPLEAINKASAKEKSIRHGHPSTLHLYWARRPLAAARAVLFASIVDDPDQDGLPPAYLKRIDALPKPTNRPDWNALSEAERRRLKLFAFIEDLVVWKNSSDKRIIQTAKELISAATDGNPPPVWDPFAGGGTILLEAQRLGLESRGSDLNPLAVLITKALIELPGKVKDQPPTHPDAHNLKLKSWEGAQGLAEDVRWWGEWLRNEAERRIGHLYPPVKVTADMAANRPDLKQYVGKELTVIAWLWTRTVKCPNPACGIQMPLIRSFQLSKKEGKQAWVEPSGLWSDAQGDRHISFIVKTERSHPNESPRTEGTVDRTGARCLHCGEAVPFPYVRQEGKRSAMAEDLMAIVAEGNRERAYISALSGHARVARTTRPKWKPAGNLPHNPRDFKTPNYGMASFAELFTDRQLTALTTLVDLLRDNNEINDRVRVYLTFMISKFADYSSSISSWHSSGEKMRNVFARQAIPMVWDFAEVNPFSSSSGNVLAFRDWIVKVLQHVPTDVVGISSMKNAAADNGFYGTVSTDPPYYDNIGYADISDFFYVWQRECLMDTYPDLFATLLTPKADELIATPYRHNGSKEKAAGFFEEGLARVWKNVKDVQDPGYPVTIYYAYKQTETGGDGDIRFTGWDTMLQAIIDAGFAITATWPVRSEMSSRMLAAGTNALASSIVLACRVRNGKDSTTSAELIEELRRELPERLMALQTSTLPPVDLAQAAVGPAMAVFSKYLEVLDVEGNRMTVARVLPIILKQLAEALNELPDLDAESRFALRWYDSNGWAPGAYGEAETMVTPMGIAVDSIDKAGIAKSSGGKVQLIRAESLPRDYDPAEDDRFTLWEVVHYLGRTLDVAGEQAAAKLLAAMQVSHPSLRTDAAKELCNALFAAADRNGRNDDARFYNQLGQLWTSIVVQSSEDAPPSASPDLFNE